MSKGGSGGRVISSGIYAGLSDAENLPGKQYLQPSGHRLLASGFLTM